MYKILFAVGVWATHTLRPVLSAVMRCWTDESCDTSVAALAGSMRISSVFSLISQWNMTEPMVERSVVSFMKKQVKRRKSM